MSNLALQSEGSRSTDCPACPGRWNFVARTEEEMAQAAEDWNAGRYFGEVKGSPSPRLVAPDLADLNLKGSRK